LGFLPWGGVVQWVIIDHGMKRWTRKGSPEVEAERKNINLFEI
jgi:hypothetical protein